MTTLLSCSSVVRTQSELEYHRLRGVLTVHLLYTLIEIINVKLFQRVIYKSTSTSGEQYDLVGAI